MRSSFLLPLAAALGACVTPDLPGKGDPTGGPDGDFGVPAEYPQINDRFHSHAVFVWVTDPGTVWEGGDELEGASDLGVFWWDYRYYAEFEPSGTDTWATIELQNLEPGTYSLVEATFEVRRTDLGGAYTPLASSAGDSHIEIVGNNGKAIWGTFEGEACYEPTPDANCFAVWDGRFAAAIETHSGDPANGGDGPAPP